MSNDYEAFIPTPQERELTLKLASSFMRDVNAFVGDNPQFVGPDANRLIPVLGTALLAAAHNIDFLLKTALVQSLALSLSGKEFSGPKN